MSREDMLSALAAWRGDELLLHNCPALDDVFLHILTTTVEDGEPKYASIIKSLRITDCPNFSVEALKTFVTSRRGVLRFIFRSDIEPEDIEVFVAGRVPYFSPEDISWFCERLPKFEYESR
jgi:hypothetical protein